MFFISMDCSCSGSIPYNVFSSDGLSKPRLDIIVLTEKELELANDEFILKYNALFADTLNTTTDVLKEEEENI